MKKNNFSKTIKDGSPDLNQNVEITRNLKNFDKNLEKSAATNKNPQSSISSNNINNFTHISINKYLVKAKN